MNSNGYNQMLRAARKPMSYFEIVLYVLYFILDFIVTN